jgi:hypothetical protein
MNDNVEIALSYRQITEEMDNCQTAAEVLEILREEVAGPNRPAFLTRIYGRYDVMRRAEERRDLALVGTGNPQDVAAWLRQPAAPAAAAPAPRGKAPAPRTATPIQAPAPAARSRAPAARGKAAR